MYRPNKPENSKDSQEQITGKFQSIQRTNRYAVDKQVAPASWWFIQLVALDIFRVIKLTW